MFYNQHIDERDSRPTLVTSPRLDREAAQLQMRETPKVYIKNLSAFEFDFRDDVEDD